MHIYFPYFYVYVPLILVAFLLLFSQCPMRMEFLIKNLKRTIIFHDYCVVVLATLDVICFLKENNTATQYSNLTRFKLIKRKIRKFFALSRILILFLFGTTIFNCFQFNSLAISVNWKYRWKKKQRNRILFQFTFWNKNECV